MFDLTGTFLRVFASRSHIDDRSSIKVESIDDTGKNVEGVSNHTCGLYSRLHISHLSGLGFLKVDMTRVSARATILKNQT